MVVELEVDGALREESGLVGGDLVEDEFATILRDHSGDERAVCDEIELCRPRVGVRGIDATRPKETGSCETWDGCGSARYRQRCRMFCALMEMSFPMVAGMVITLAEELKPPAPTVLAETGAFAKSNLYASSGRIPILMTGSAAFTSLEMRSD